MEVVLRYKLLTAYTANTALHNLYSRIHANILLGKVKLQLE